jgi:protein phosphatase
VAIYRGIQRDLGPISLHSIYTGPVFRNADLPSYTRKTVEDTISAADAVQRSSSV